MLHHLLSCVITVCLLTAALGQAPDAPDPAKLKVEFTGGKLVVSGKKLTLPFRARS